jgi:tetratricopeptide (TPR) repeat protein
MSPKKKIDGPIAYKLKLTIQGVEPPIWRRLLVRGDTNLAALHDIIQTVMGWGDSHLHVFTIEKVEYGSCFDEDELEFEDDSGYILDDVLDGKKMKFSYMYDFGDSWEIEVAVEAVEPVDEDNVYPVCLAGERSGPMEDSGGAWGYSEKLEILQNPEHPDYADIVEWMGDDWDAEYFDLAELNDALQHAFAAGDDVDFENLDEDEQEEIIESMLEHDPFLEERVIRLNDRIAKVHGLDDPDALHDFVEAMSPEDLHKFAMKHMGDNPQDAAFELGLLALESDDPIESSGFADKALELDPRNVDARIAKSHIALSDGDYESAIAMLREGLAVASADLNDKLSDNSLDFGELIETRPYMRVRFTLANTLHAIDKTEEAVEHYQEMLVREPDDSMGARYTLAGVYLELGRVKEARAIIAEYNIDGDPILPWAHVLERLLSGKKKEAEAGLEFALAANPLMATSLLDPDSIPDLDEDTDLGITTKMTLAAVGKAWLQNEKAIDWLASKVYDK